MLYGEILNNKFDKVSDILRKKADAEAVISGSDKYKDIKGLVQFFQTKYGVVVATVVNGLPYSDIDCRKDIFAYHIHEGSNCEGNKKDAFANSKAHYNPNGCEHPNHAGDLLPLIGNKGYAFSVFLTDRFNVVSVVGKTVIIHANADDFTTQPSGNSGEKIACGVVKLSSSLYK